MTARPLRPHQIDGLDRLRDALRASANAVVFQAPTGFGKTRVMAEIALRATARGKRVLICVPALSLIDQTVLAMRAEGLDDLGVIQADHELTNAKAVVQIASVQTLQKREMPPADLILIDEVHRWFRFYETIIADAKAADTIVIGVSATPWTKGLGKHFDTLIQVATTADLIAMGYLSPFRVFAPSHPDLDEVRTVAGDYHKGDLADAMNTPALVADVVSTWRQRAEDRPTLCFAVDRAHAGQLQSEFESAGIATDYVDAHTPRAERQAVADRFHSGQTKVVCNVGCLTTGVDWDVRCIILARPTKSEMLFVQIVGRGLRTAPGKDYCLILDHSDTHERLGFVTDIHHAGLDDGVRKEPASSVGRPQQCPACSCLVSPTAKECPACGHVVEVRRKREFNDGKLVEYQRQRRDAAADRKADVYGQLRAIAEERGYATGWVAHTFRAYFGTWPVGLKAAPCRRPRMDILHWVRSRQSAYAQKLRATG